eukprot:gene1509-32887_t
MSRGDSRTPILGLDRAGSGLDPGWMVDGGWWAYAPGTYADLHRGPTPGVAGPTPAYAVAAGKLLGTSSTDTKRVYPNMVSESRWKVKQVTQPDTPDLRGSVLGPKGYKERCKRKRDEQHLLEVIDPSTLPGAGMEVDDEDGAASKRRKAEGAKFIPVSGRTWKGESKPAGRVMKCASATTWEKKMEEKAIRANFLLRKKEALEIVTEAKKAKGLERKNAFDPFSSDFRRYMTSLNFALPTFLLQAKGLERKNARERKKANQEKSQVVQKVSTNTVKRMMKNRKQKKLLKKADTNP